MHGVMSQFPPRNTTEISCPVSEYRKQILSNEPPLISELIILKFIVHGNMFMKFVRRVSERPVF